METLLNESIINKSQLDNLDYPNLWHDHNQFWRKFFSRVTKKQNSKYIKSFEKWIKNHNNDYYNNNHIKYFILYHSINFCTEINISY